MLVLEEVFKSQKYQNTDQFNLRVHRGLSWLKKAGQLDADLDLKFSCLWVSFNAIYAQDFVLSQDKLKFRQFLNDVYQVDNEHRIDQMIWNKLNQPIQTLLENPYIFQQFWDYQNQKITQHVWKESFETAKKEVSCSLQSKDTVAVLCVTFNRLYTLRNQLIHGGATYNSSVNRQQIQQACYILSSLISAFIFILLENTQSLDLEQPFYPVVQVC